MPGSTFAWLFLSRLSSFSSQEGVCFILSSLDDQMIVECKTIPNQKKKKPKFKNSASLELNMCKC